MAWLIESLSAFIMTVLCSEPDTGKNKLPI